MDIYIWGGFPASFKPQTLQLCNSILNPAKYAEGLCLIYMIPSRLKFSANSKCQHDLMSSFCGKANCEATQASLADEYLPP